MPREVVPGTTLLYSGQKSQKHEHYHLLFSTDNTTLPQNYHTIFLILKNCYKHYRLLMSNNNLCILCYYVLL